jgi:hypothetical protein
MDPTDIGGRELYAKAAFIAQCLYSYCVLPDNGVRLRKTASISPGTSLKHREANKAFQWANQVRENQKFFTLAACREGIKMLLEKPHVEVPLVGLSMDAWITNQAKLVLKLCQRARINSGSSFRFAAYRQSKIMDWDETQAIEARPGFWWCSGGTNYISQCFLSHIYPENSNEHDWRYCYPLNCISVNIGKQYPSGPATGP